jgi:hypothetical protein
MRTLFAILIVTGTLAALPTITTVGPRVPAYGTWANRPGSAANGTVYIVTDDASAGACTVGGSVVRQCRWNGSEWAALGGGGGVAPAPYYSGLKTSQNSVAIAGATHGFTTTPYGLAVMVFDNENHQRDGDQSSGECRADRVQF